MMLDNQRRKNNKQQPSLASRIVWRREDILPWEREDEWEHYRKCHNYQVYINEGIGLTDSQRVKFWAYQTRLSPEFRKLFKTIFKIQPASS